MTLDAIKRLGGVRPAARALGVPPTTVFNWTRNGIPHWRVPQIEAALRALDDFDDLNRGRDNGVARG